VAAFRHLTESSPIQFGKSVFMSRESRLLWGERSQTFDPRAPAGGTNLIPLWILSQHLSLVEIGCTSFVEISCITFE
jgi:hypothetical protein